MEQEPPRFNKWNQPLPLLPAFMSIILVVLGLGTWLRNEMIRNNYAFTAAPQSITSDGAQGSVTLASPNGGEVFTKGASVSVAWRTQGLPDSLKTVSFFLVRQTPSGAPQQFTLAQNLPNNGSTQLTIPDSIPTGKYTLKIRIPHFKGLPNLVEDVSDTAFQVLIPECDTDSCASLSESFPAPQLYNDEVPCPPPTPWTNCINVVSPNGDEVVDRSQPFTITWDYQGIPADETVIVFLSRIVGNGRQDYPIARDDANILVSKKYYTFTIPGNLPNGNYKARLVVKEIKGSLPNIVVGYSDNAFEITGETGGTDDGGGGGITPMSKNEQPCPPNPGYQNCIDVVSPNGTETIDRANPVTVTWKYEGIPDDEIVMVFLRRITQQGQQDYTINKHVPIAPKSHTFYVPDNLPNGNYKMKLVVKEIKGSLPNLVFGYSDKTFAITGTSGGSGGTSQVITVDAPVAGDVLYKGDYIPVVRWRSTGIAPDNKSITIFLQYDEPGPHNGKKFFIESKLLNDGIEEQVFIPIRDRILPGKYKVGVRAEKVGTTKLPTGLSGVVSVKDGTGIAGSGVFAPTIKRYTCEQVRDGQSPIVDVWPWPDGTVGHPATQFDSRRMVEARQFDCAPRSIAWAIDILQDTPVGDEAIQKQINDHMRIARWWHAKAMARYMKDTVKAVDSGKAHNHFIGTGEYAWIYIPNAFQEIRRALSLNVPALQEYLAGQGDCLNGSNACADQMMRLVGIRITNGKVNEGSASYSPTPKSSPFKIEGQKDFDLLGSIGGVMTFEPLNPAQIALLDETQRLHTRWAEAAVKEGDHAIGHPILMQYVIEHHDAHIALEQTAVSLNQQILLSIPDHGMHNVCMGRPHAEMSALVMKSEGSHQKWVAAVKAGKFAGPDGAWQLGLLHSRDHVILANCNMNDRNLPVFGIDTEFPAHTFDIAPDFDIRKAPKK